MIYLKGKATKNTQQGSHQIWCRNQKFYRQAKAKKIQHYQSSFKTNAKGTSLRRKEMATTRNKKITK